MKKTDIEKKAAVLNEAGNKVVIEEIVRTERVQSYEYALEEIEEKLESLEKAKLSSIDARDRHVAKMQEGIDYIDAQIVFWTEKKTEAETLGLKKQPKK